MDYAVYYSLLPATHLITVVNRYHGLPVGAGVLAFTSVGPRSPRFLISQFHPIHPIVIGITHAITYRVIVRMTEPAMRILAIMLSGCQTRRSVETKKNVACFGCKLLLKKSSMHCGAKLRSSCSQRWSRWEYFHGSFFLKYCEVDSSRFFSPHKNVDLHKICITLCLCNSWKDESYSAASVSK